MAAAGVTHIVAGGRSSGPMGAREKAEFRAQVQNTVQEFCARRRAELLPALRQEHPSYTEEQIMALLDDRQPMYEDYDPVVQLALLAVDHRHSPELRRQAAQGAADFLRPKLKAVEVSLERPEDQQMRDELVDRIAGQLDRIAAEKRGEIVEGVAREVVPSDDPVDTDRPPAEEDVP